ncbi:MULTISPECIES: flagellar basal-body rod protein FlgG [Vibrio]|jgi:flagellar basal-body rod protein FlgG|uniref:Flagellar basal-body rod protein FlgG n=8 Tax=Vibrio TaxID=662 RepID=A0A0H0YBL7_VIBAL|nr:MULTISPECIES: flagellar basal-body rod protein FlgG [Vibrio]EEZ83950.1 Putative flagellar basal-body rod protein flgG [Vibrio alginolyticus 40B]MDW1808338.1 flagellar basal-body rod protein FlgG [Vibrio sp. Vb2362]MDW2257465.1 flagellar basal-body rod protein FlgG [Vibrio sp. 1409]MDW2297618.1 flagellar basal-body rod protein FlgG [Vibrio sp. 1404]NAW54106.1 flagellar basal-body rod protein FlgG [Vibrio sp. V41_P2S12T139]QCO88525.1 flagellar basal-body rod protein FlgG [Vibrio neocaledonic
MHSALWVSKTGMAAQDTKMTAISNNLANVNTVGFKRDRVVFEDLFYSIQRQPGAQVDQVNELPSGIQLGSGVRVVGTQKVFTQGNTQNTTQELDLAVMGQGFFQIENSDGQIMYTRNGQFHRNSEGLMVNSQGLPLEPQIQIPDNAVSFSVGVDGTVTTTTADDPTPQQLGQITLAKFINPAGLEAMGGNLFRETEASGPADELIAGADGAGIIKQGALEGSNVQVVEEMVDMITTQRAYEMNAKVVSAADDMLKFVSQSM